MTAPIETTGAQAEVQPEAVLATPRGSRSRGAPSGVSPGTASRGTRSPSPHGVVVILLILIAALARPLQHLFGLDPNTFHQDLIDPTSSLPKGGLGGMSGDHPLGVEPKFGRDIFARILEGSWVSSSSPSARPSCRT